MKKITQKELTFSRPNIELIDGLKFCLRQLYKDTKHYISDEIVRCLTFEELIGVLLLALDKEEGK